MRGENTKGMKEEVDRVCCGIKWFCLESLNNDLEIHFRSWPKGGGETITRYTTNPQALKSFETVVLVYIAESQETASRNPRQEVLHGAANIRVTGRIQNP